METRSTCPYCGVGCGVIIEHDATQITGVRGDPDHPANFGRLCTKGGTLHLTAAPLLQQQTRLLQLEQELGRRVREALESHGYPSVAAEGFKAPGVVVSYTSDPDIQSGKKFLAVGLQTAAGVPLQCDEPPDFRSFRIGLFGLEKLHNPERTVDNLAKALLLAPSARAAAAVAQRSVCFMTIAPYQC